MSIEIKFGKRDVNWGFDLMMWEGGWRMEKKGEVVVGDVVECGG